MAALRRGSGGIHAKAADVGANIIDKVEFSHFSLSVITENDGDIAGIVVCDMNYSVLTQNQHVLLLFLAPSPHLEATMTAMLSLLISSAGILVCLLIM
ncbi:pyrophosphate-energized vacuolar membrane proton pump-like [Rhododendron vialii]|uniref:pyrophosphate-energized vacuolar membrane proton pump-like n=1 Tax=Rhododendron vialii TaxID=182163 RepID=UPI00265EACA3|nr:pyrophosphate-energized vacuolar membrane proton pump-like [Rhododendron vialii]